jgi:hypothetical protein
VLHILTTQSPQHQQQWSIHLKTLTISNNHYLQPSFPILLNMDTLVLAHESLPNSFTEWLMRQSFLDRLLSRFNNMSLLCVIPNSAHAVVSFPSVSTMLHIVDLNQINEHQQVIASFDVESLINQQREQERYSCFHCSDFGTIKLDTYNPFGNSIYHQQENNNVENSKLYGQSQQEQQFVIHGNMFCLYRRSDGQLYGGTLERSLKNSLQSYNMIILFKMTIPCFEFQILQMFPDGPSQTAFIAIKQRGNNNNKIHCFYVRPMNDVYVSMRYELSNVCAAVSSRPILNRYGETVAYLRNDGGKNEIVRVFKLGHYNCNLKVNHDSINNCADYNLKKILARRLKNDMVSLPMMDAQLYTNPLNKPKKRMKRCTGAENITLSYQQQFSTISIIQSNDSGNSIFCIQQSLSGNMLRVINVNTEEVLEFNIRLPTLQPQQLHDDLSLNNVNNYNNNVNNHFIFQQYRTPSAKRLQRHKSKSSSPPIPVRKRKRMPSDFEI